MATMSKSPTQSNPTVVTKREGTTYYKTLVRSGYAPVNGLEMYYEMHGSGTGVPLVTIHGFAGLANVFPSLTRNRQLIAFEFEGHGHTADIGRPLSFEQEAEDVASLLKYLEISQADFFGESFGGIVAVQTVVRHPEMVRRVATYGSALGKIEEVTRQESLAGSRSKRLANARAVIANMKAFGLSPTYVEFEGRLIAPRMTCRLAGCSISSTGIQRGVK